MRWRKRSVAGVPSEMPTTCSNYVAVAVPADARAGIVAGEQDMDEIVRRDARRRRRLVARSGCSQSGIGSAGVKLASSKS